MKSIAARFYPYILNMTMYLHSGFFLSENQRMQNKFHNPTSCIQRASHISCDLSYSPETILVSHNHTSNTPYVQFGCSSFKKLINVAVRCNCNPSKNNYLQYSMPGKALIGITKNTSALFSYCFMGPIQRPGQANESLTTAFGRSPILVHQCGAQARKPNDQRSPCVFIHAIMQSQRKNKLPVMFLLPRDAEEPVIKALEMRMNTALSTHSVLLLFSKTTNKSIQLIS